MIVIIQKFVSQKKKLKMYKVYKVLEEYKVLLEEEDYQDFLIIAMLF